MIAFVNNHRDANGIELIPRVLPIAPSSYHERVAQRQDPTRPSARALQDVALKSEIARVRRELRGLPHAQGLAADDAGGLCGCALYRGKADAREGLGRSNLWQADAHDHQLRKCATPARSRQPTVLDPAQFKTS